LRKKCDLDENLKNRSKILNKVNELLFVAYEGADDRVCSQQGVGELFIERNDSIGHN
jgi:hypothetical protein